MLSLSDITDFFNSLNSLDFRYQFGFVMFFILLYISWISYNKIYSIATTISLLLIIGVLLYFFSEKIIELVRRFGVWTSIAVLICIVVVSVMINSAIYINNNIKTIKSQWPTYRCKPQIIPFAGFIGPDGITTMENFNYCVYKQHESIFQILMSPYDDIISSIATILKGNVDDIQSIRQFMAGMRSEITNALKDVYQKIYDAYARLATLFANFVNILSLLFTTFEDMFNTMLYTYYSMASLWNNISGPVGDIEAIANFFCFSGSTPINMTKSAKLMRDIEVGDIMRNGGKIMATICAINMQPNNYYKLGNANTLVAGNHLMCAKKQNRWMRVNESLLATKSRLDDNYIYTAITSNGLLDISTNITEQILYSDYLETNNINYLERTHLALINYLNGNEFNINTVKHTGGLDLWGFTQDTYISGIKITEIQIGNKISTGKVNGIVQIDGKKIKLYSYRGIIASGSMIINYNGKWRQMKDVGQLIEDTHEKLYNIIVDTGIIEISGILYRDFERTSNPKINAIIDETTTKLLNQI